MNYESCESFIDFCDNMMIANEGKIKDAVNRLITVDPKKAKNADSTEDVRKLTLIGTPLIRINGSLKGEIENYLKKAKKDFRKPIAAVAGQAAISAAAVALAPILPLSAINGLIWGSAGAAFAVTSNVARKNGDVASYKLAKGSDGGLYLVARGRKIG